MNLSGDDSAGEANVHFAASEGNDPLDLGFGGSCPLPGADSEPKFAIFARGNTHRNARIARLARHFECDRRGRDKRFQKAGVL
jgi:hypothetical protein